MTEQEIKDIAKKKLEAQKKKKADAEAMERVFARNAQETKTESTESDNT